jgi:hypothetical protein
MTDYLALLESDQAEPTHAAELETREADLSSPIIPMPPRSNTELAPVLEHMATELEEHPEILPAQSPWFELANSAQEIWDALEAQGTRTLHLIDQDGRKACHCFTASKPSDLRELARRGLKTFPRVTRLTVVAVLPSFAIWQLEPRTVN